MIKKILKIGAFVAFLGLVAYTLKYLYDKNQAPTVFYEVVSPANRDIKLETMATGSVKPRREIMIKPVVSGIVDELYVEAGDKVAKNDILARVKIIPDMVNLNNAENRLSRAKIQLETALNDYNRFEKLFDQEVISANDFQPYQVALKNARLELQAAQDNLDIIKEGVSKNSAGASNTLVRSTIDGMVLDVPVEEGNQVIESNTFNEGTTIASVADMSDMIFEGYLDESEVGRVTVGLPIVLTIGALPNQTFAANLEYIAPKGEDRDGSIQFLIRAALTLSDSNFIRAGYSANASIVLDQRIDVLTVPESVVSFEGDSTFVYKQTSPQKFERIPVQLGLSDGIHAEVLSGIAANDELKGKEQTAN